MKKVMILLSAIVLTASAATAAYVFSQKSSGLFEANVAALTDGESYTSWGCRGGISVCEAECGVCHTRVSGTGRLTGSHTCSR